MSLRQKLCKQLKGEEGFSSYAYLDTKGLLTIGHGRLIDKRHGGGLTAEEAEYLLGNDIAKCEVFLAESLPWAASLVEARQGVLLNMCFQLGPAGLMGFRKMLAACRDARYAEAAEQMRNSKWATDTPARCRRLAHQMETGEWQ